MHCFVSFSPIVFIDLQWKLQFLTVISYWVSFGMMLVAHGSLATDIPKIPGCHLLQQMNSQWGLQKLFQVSVFYELTAFLSHFDLFQHNEIVILSKGHKPDNCSVGICNNRRNL